MLYCLTALHYKTLASQSYPIHVAEGQEDQTLCSVSMKSPGSASHTNKWCIND